LDLPPVAKNIELKPYAISKLTSARLRADPVENDLTATAGISPSTPTSRRWRWTSSR
jgi:hypothetical protein